MTGFQRRQILKAFGALTATSVLPAPSLARSTDMPEWHIGWQNPVQRHLETRSLKRLSGVLPDELRGTFYRNGPAIHERGGKRMQHWFDGDGMVQAFRFSDGGISHLGRPVETKLYKQNEQEGRFTVGGFGTTVTDSFAVSSPNDANAANTSVLRVGDELWALWEAGSAYRLNPETLETYGPKIWTDGLQGMPFSAHPKVDQLGNIWNFGQSVHLNALIIYKLDPAGTLLTAKIVRDVPPGMIHDFCITDRHLIFMANSFRATLRGRNYLSQFTYLEDAPQRVIVLDMDNLEERRDYELPPGFQFHFGNAYQEVGGDIRFTLCATDRDQFVSRGAKQVMRGELPDGDVSQLCEVVLSGQGQAKVTPISDRAVGEEFPQFNPNFGGKAARYLYTVGNQLKDRPGRTAILRHDLQSGDVQAYDYGETALVEEHLFVPSVSPKSETDGWLIGTVLDFKTKVTRVNILRADALSDGPVGVFELPYALPLGFHGTWAGSR